MCSLAETSLSIVKTEEFLNMSTSQDIDIPCHIINRSSSESEFQITWFWQKETETEQRPIFTAYRNSTLQDRFGKGDRLRFRHPLPNQFSLTVLKPSPASSGVYSCEVEEWLLTLSHGWRKVAVEKSGYLSVNVYAEGKHIYKVIRSVSQISVLENHVSGFLLVALLPCNFHDFLSCIQRLNMQLLCPVVVSLEQQHETKTNSMFACRMHVIVGAAVDHSQHHRAAS